MLKRSYQILLISFLTLTVFYPSIFAELNSIDDVEMVTNLLNMQDWSLKGLFLPAAGGGLYYRPLLYGTFIFDRFVWEAGASFMHLENILLHLANGLFVYAIAAAVILPGEREKSRFPLLASLMFALHPLVTEPTNWVSGRTDLLAGFFLLASTLALIQFRNLHRRKYLFLALTTFLCGMLSKEVALMFLPGAFLLLIAKGETAEESLFLFIKRQGRKLLFLCIAGLGCLAIFFLLRDGAFTSNSSRIGMTLQFMKNDPVHTLFVFLRAFGFYCKKFFWPFPLNFAIVEVDPLYELLAMAVIPALAYVAFKRTIGSALLLTGVFLITPSFVIAYNQVAWTPYAERYIYISTAFVVLATGLYLRSIRHLFPPVAVKTCIAGLLTILFVSTFQRNLVWRTNVSLYTDTSMKSPTFTKPWNQLGIAYYQKKDYPNAELNFARASSLFEFSVDERSDLNLAVVLVDQGKIIQAKTVYADILKKGGASSEKVVNHYVAFLSDRITEEKDPRKKTEMMKEILATYEKLYASNKNPVTLYNIGNMRLQLGDARGARSAYLTSYEMLSEKDRYRSNISKQLAAMGLRL